MIRVLSAAEAGGTEEFAGLHHPTPEDEEEFTAAIEALEWAQDERERREKRAAVRRHKK